MRRLLIDWTRCAGHGLCVEVFPDAIVADDWGYPVIRRPDVSPDELPEARRAVAVCPALALRLEGPPDISGPRG